MFGFPWVPIRHRAGGQWMSGFPRNEPEIRWRVEGAVDLHPGKLGDHPVVDFN